MIFKKYNFSKKMTLLFCTLLVLFISIFFTFRFSIKNDSSYMNYIIVICLSSLFIVHLLIRKNQATFNKIKKSDIIKTIPQFFDLYPDKAYKLKSFYILQLIFTVIATSCLCSTILLKWFFF